jgi:hypothetical protein
VVDINRGRVDRTGKKLLRKAKGFLESVAAEPVAAGQAMLYDEECLACGSMKADQNKEANRDRLPEIHDLGKYKETCTSGS